MAHYLESIDKYRRREITRFVDAHRHDRNITEIAQMKWIAEAMELMKDTQLSNAQKRELVIALYTDMAKADTNDFKEEFDAEQAIEFVWDTAKDRYGLTLRRKGCLKSCIPSCCSDVSVVVENGNVKVGANAKEQPVPPVLPRQ